jgi:hypothetical protein
MQLRGFQSRVIYNETSSRSASPRQEAQAPKGDYATELQQGSLNTREASS